jgi:hypothetical protein
VPDRLAARLNRPTPKDRGYPLTHAACPHFNSMPHHFKFMAPNCLFPNLVLICQPNAISEND